MIWESHFWKSDILKDINLITAMQNRQVDAGVATMP